MRASMSPSKPASGRAKVRDGLDQGGRDRMAAAAGGQRVAPPLQADFAEHRIADRVADARDLGVEGVEREEMLARRRRREQVGEVAVAIELAHRLGAVLVDIHGRQVWRAAPRSVHGNQRRGDRPLLGQQHVEGAHRRAGRHRLGDDPGFAAALPRARAESGTMSAPVPTSRIWMSPASAKTLSRLAASMAPAAGACQP